MPATADPIRHRLSVDIGGTFTDVVLEGGGRRATLKLLTTPRAPEEAVIAGSLELIGRAGLAPADIAVFVHGTTLATNAIIERKGARVALIATQGHRDIIEVADESRYDQFDLFLERPRPLVERHLRFTGSTRALAILGEDLKYLETLELPLARRDSEQQKIHAANLERIEAEPGA